MNTIVQPVVPNAKPMTLYVPNTYTDQEVLSQLSRQQNEALFRKKLKIERYNAAQLPSIISGHGP